MKLYDLIRNLFLFSNYLSSEVKLWMKHLIGIILIAAVNINLLGKLCLSMCEFRGLLFQRPFSSLTLGGQLATTIMDRYFCHTRLELGFWIQDELCLEPEWDLKSHLTHPPAWLMDLFFQCCAVSPPQLFAPSTKYEQCSVPPPSICIFVKLQT